MTPDLLTAAKSIRDSIRRDLDAATDPKRRANIARELEVAEFQVQQAEAQNGSAGLE